MITNANDVFSTSGTKSGWLGTAAVLALLMVAGGWYWLSQSGSTAHAEPATAEAERRTFKNVLRRQGFIQPFKEERIFTQLNGTIQELALEGTLAKKDDVVLKLDALPHEDAKALQEDTMAIAAADFNKVREASLKILNLAREDVNSYELRLELEKLRLEEIKRGPTPTDEINAQVNLDNNKLLLKAKQEESEVIDYLAKLNYASKDEARQKQLDVTEQQLKVVEMDIALRKLHIIDPVKVAQQELKVSGAIKTRNAAMEKVVILEKSIAQADARYKMRRERDEEHLKDLQANISKTSYRAPCSGVVVPRKPYKGYAFAPGREVFDGMEVLSIPDMSKMKVKLTVDEGRVGSVTPGMPASVIPAGWTGPPFNGKVMKISEQGRDEFEQFSDDTTQISGTANRKVFEVEIELQEHSPVLRLGLRCDVEIVLGKLDGAIVIPRAALIKSKDGGTVVLISKDKGGVESRKVKVNSESELWAAVEGIAPGERVLLAEAKTE